MEQSTLSAASMKQITKGNSVWWCQHLGSGNERTCGWARSFSIQYLQKSQNYRYRIFTCSHSAGKKEDEKISIRLSKNWMKKMGPLNAERKKWQNAIWASLVVKTPWNLQLLMLEPICLLDGNDSGLNPVLLRSYQSYSGQRWRFWNMIITTTSVVELYYSLTSFMWWWEAVSKIGPNCALGTEICLWRTRLRL